MVKTIFYVFRNFQPLTNFCGVVVDGIWRYLLKSNRSGSARCLTLKIRTLYFENLRFYMSILKIEL